MKLRFVWREFNSPLGFGGAVNAACRFEWRSESGFGESCGGRRGLRNYCHSEDGKLVDRELWTVLCWLRGSPMSICNSSTHALLLVDYSRTSQLCRDRAKRAQRQAARRQMFLFVSAKSTLHTRDVQTIAGNRDLALPSRI